MTVAVARTLDETPQRPLQVLLVEDDATDAALTKRALEVTPAPLVMRSVVSLEQAHAALNDRRPDVIILDLHLEDGSGLDLLHALKRHEDHRSIPVVVVSANDDPDTIRSVYDAQAAGFLAKPTAFKDYQESLQSLLAFWSQARRAA